MAIDRTKDTRAARLAGMPKTTGSLEPMPRRCREQLSFTGKGEGNPPRYCMQWPVRGRTKCPIHGGKTLQGVAHPFYKPTTYSQALPASVKDTYEALLRDDDLLSLKHEIATTRAFAVQTLQRMRDGEWASPALLRAVTKVLSGWNKLDAARRTKGGQARVAGILQELGASMLELVDASGSANAELASRHEFQRTVLTLERLERSENTRVVELYGMISAERAFALRQAETTIFLEALDEYVMDRDVKTAIRRRVANKFAELAARRDGAPVGAGGGHDAAPGDSAPAQPAGAGGVLLGDAGPAVPVDAGLPQP